MEVLVPDLGEFADVEVIEILIGVGDTVTPEDSLIVLETDKATMDVPATDAGVITALQVEVGDRVSTGDAILLLDPDSSGVGGASAAETASVEAAAESKSSPSANV